MKYKLHISEVKFGMREDVMLYQGDNIPESEVASQLLRHGGYTQNEAKLLIDYADNVKKAGGLDLKFRGAGYNGREFTDVKFSLEAFPSNISYGLSVTDFSTGTCLYSEASLKSQELVAYLHKEGFQDRAITKALEAVEHFGHLMFPKPNDITIKYGISYRVVGK